MLVYNTEVEFLPHGSITKKNVISIVEDFTIDPGICKDILSFYNNQEREISLCTDGVFYSPKKSQTVIFTVKNVISFLWITGESTIYYKLYAEGTDKLLHYWLLHTLLPMYLTLEKNNHFFHVGAISVDSSPVIFMANSFGGKSTITDFFLQKGHSLITDDKLATFEKNGKFYLTPSYPYHRPYREVETLGILTKNFEKNISLINSIYVLIKSDAKSNINISEIKGIKKFKQLILGTEVKLPFLFKKEINYLTQLAKQVKVYNIQIPWDMDRLEEVYSTIIKHQQDLKKGN